ncbi:MAG: hypothetical protein AAF772_01410, partial [Acidobacteriota bacterium]
RASIDWLIARGTAGEQADARAVAAWLDGVDTGDGDPHALRIAALRAVATDGDIDVDAARAQLERALAADGAGQLRPLAQADRHILAGIAAALGLDDEAAALNAQAAAAKPTTLVGTLLRQRAGG